MDTKVVFSVKTYNIGNIMGVYNVTYSFLCLTLFAETLNSQYYDGNSSYPKIIARSSWAMLSASSKRIHRLRFYPPIQDFGPSSNICNVLQHPVENRQRNLGTTTSYRKNYDNSL